MNLLEEIQNAPVEWKELGEVCEIKKGKQLNKTLLIEDGLYPAYNGGKTYSGRTNEYNVKENTIIISQGGASAGFVNFVETKFWANAHCYFVVPNSDIVLNRYLYHFLKMNQGYLMESQHGSGIPALKQDKILKIEIPIPDKKIQEKIVQTLDKFTDYVTELTSELTLRQKQYSYFRDYLLNFEEDSYKVEWKSLGEVCEIIRGNGLQKKDFVEEGIPCIHYGQIYTYYGMTTSSTKSFVNEYTAKKLKKAILGDIIVATTSENITDVGKTLVWEGEQEVCFGGHSCVLRTQQNSRYLSYFMSSSSFQKQKEKQVVGTKVIELYPKNLAKILVPIPPLSIQEKIVHVLDNFDTVCNDLNIGLPKEIELRQKQYEYFRDQLLTYTAEGVYTDSTVQYSTVQTRPN